jgi:hypothetical protein
MCAATHACHCTHQSRKSREVEASSANARKYSDDIIASDARLHALGR